MALSLIVFDCDGVLLESMDIKSMAFRRVGERLGSEAADRLVMYHHMHGGISRFKKFARILEDMGREVTDEVLDALNKEFVAAAYEAMQHCPLVPGVLEVLERWHGRVPLYVASGAPEDELRTILEKRGLSEYFSGIFGSPAAKSSILRSIVERTGVCAFDMLMVGDSRIDLSAAETAGARFYGRGEFFKASGWPWHEDLTLLNDYLEQLAGED